MTAPTVSDVLRERAATGRLLRLYCERDMQATHWIGEDENGALFEFPAEVGGWRQRLPFTGGREYLTETQPVGLSR